MCGIAGFISDNPHYDSRAIVGQMLDIMHYRGPEQAGIGSYGNCTIGMVRLSICDTAEHEIPIPGPGGHQHIVYNGEIYNAEEIRRSLRDQSFFRTRSDAEVALRSYGEKGVSAFDYFNGMYALAIWDERTEELLAVRDKAGEKPLYYCEGKDFFAFASEMKCLHGLVTPSFNAEANSYQAFEFTCGKETLFKDIFSLEPGEFIRYRNGRSTIHSYWKIWNNLIEVPEDYDKVKAELTELIHDAVSLRTNNCAHNHGVLVSGGLDSALVACITKPDVIFTCHYDLGEDFDELNYAKLVAEKIGQELQIIEPSPDDFLRTEEDIAYHLDTPCTWTSFSWWMLMEQVSRQVKVIMTGDGADETFGGYHRYLLLHHDEQIHRMGAMAQYAYLIDRYYGSSVKRYAKVINRAGTLHSKVLRNYLEELVGYYFSKMDDNVVHAMGVADFYTTMQVLLQMSDRICMAHSVENRSPFLDHRLLQYSFSMSPNFKIRNGVTKAILKDIAKAFIPLEIVERIDKRGFSAPINHWFAPERYGKYNRELYRKRVFDVWRQIFLEGDIQQNLPKRLNTRLFAEPLSVKEDHFAASYHHC
jgi:asparagine synthase (glutamine-hydrolysing)